MTSLVSESKVALVVVVRMRMGRRRNSRMIECIWFGLVPLAKVE